MHLSAGRFRAQGRRPRALRPATERLDARILLSTLGQAAGSLLPGSAGSVAQPAILGQVLPANLGATNPANDTGSTSPTGFTPGQIRAAYGFSSIQFGMTAGNGAGQTIAIVDAYNDPYLVSTGSSNFATSDLARFDAAFHLPDPPSFIKVGEYGTGQLPGADPTGAGAASGNWETEEALDVEWAHALAPQANIVLVETNSGSSLDLYQGVRTALAMPNVSVVSMSWGSPEYSSERAYDSTFTTPAGHIGVTFVAATGDLGSPGEYPAFSPNVVAAGGTTLTLGSGGGYGSETPWALAGGGVSAFEPAPAYQLSAQATGMRTTPDVAFDANPSTGVAVYDQFNTSPGQPWELIGGTSLAAPSWAALVAIVDQGRVQGGGATLDGPSQALPALYGLGGGAFHFVPGGSGAGFHGYNDATGLGSPIANVVAADLSGIQPEGPAVPPQPVITTQPGLVVAGSGFSIGVDLQSPTGALLTSDSGTATIQLLSGPSGSFLMGSTTAQVQSGRVIFNGLALNLSAPGDVLRVLVDGVAVDTAPIAVVPGAAARLVFETPLTQSVALGAAFGLTVVVEDSFGNWVSSYSGIVGISVMGAQPGVLGGVDVTLANNGIASFNQLVFEKSSSNDTLVVYANGLEAAELPGIAIIAPPRGGFKPHAHKVAQRHGHPLGVARFHKRAPHARFALHHDWHARR